LKGEKEMAIRLPLSFRRVIDWFIPDCVKLSQVEELETYWHWGIHSTVEKEITDQVKLRIQEMRNDLDQFAESVNTY
jgi:hypothetical protein